MINENIDMFQIIRRGRFKEFKDALKKDDINTLLNEDEKNMLIVSIENNKYDIAELLILEGSDVNHQDKDGNTSLHYVAKLYTDIKYAELLINNKCKINIENKYGNEPLWDAVFNACKVIHDGENDLVIYLIKKGANPFHKNNSDKSPLDFVQKINDETIIKILSDQI